MTKWRMVASAAAVALVVAACGSNEGDTAPESDGGDATESEAEDEDEGSDSEGEASMDEEFDSIELTLASGIPESHHTGHHAKWWADRVAELTDGQVVIDFAWSGSVAGLPEMIEVVADGLADMGQADTVSSPGSMSLTSIHTVPWLAENGQAQVKALQDAYNEMDIFREEFESQNVRLIGFQPIDPILISSDDEPILAPGDLEGRTTRAVGLWAQAVAEPGANVIAVPFGEIYESAQRGLMDSLALQLEGVGALSVYEQLPQIAYPQAGAVGILYLVINLDTWESLPTSVQAAMDQAAEESQDVLPELYNELNDALCQQMIDGGAEFHRWSDEASAEFRELVGDDLLDSWYDEVGRSAETEEFLEFYLTKMDEYALESDFSPGIEVCLEM